MLLEDAKCEVLKTNARNPLPSNYRQDLDVTEDLGPELLSEYLQIVGILCGVIELGRIDIFHETLLLSKYQADLRVVHLEYLHRIFACLKSHMNMGSIGYDPMYPNVDLLLFNNIVDWTGFLGTLRKSYHQRC